MKTKAVLDEINNNEHVNEAISRDEENRLKDADVSRALLMAEDLILQLPAGHEGRRQWLIRFGQSDEADSMRTQA